MSDRANRLRERRNKSKEAVRSQTDETEKTSESSKPDKPSKTSHTGETKKTEEKGETSVKDEQVGTYLYLPEGQRDEMKYRYKMLSAEYEREFGEEFEKNRHFYPLVIEHGLDSLSGLDAQEVRDLLGDLDY